MRRGFSIAGWNHGPRCVSGYHLSNAFRTWSRYERIYARKTYLRNDVRCTDVGIVNVATDKSFLVLDY